MDGKEKDQEGQKGLYWSEQASFALPSEILELRTGEDSAKQVRLYARCQNSR